MSFFGFNYDNSNSLVFKQDSSINYPIYSSIKQTISANTFLQTLFNQPLVFVSIINKSKQTFSELFEAYLPMIELYLPNKKKIRQSYSNKQSQRPWKISYLIQSDISHMVATCPIDTPVSVRYSKSLLSLRQLSNHTKVLSTTHRLTITFNLGDSSGIRTTSSTKPNAALVLPISSPWQPPSAKNLTSLQNVPLERPLH